MSRIVIAYLISGQIIVGKLEENQNTEADVPSGTLVKPLEILAAPTPRGVQVSFMPYGSLFGVLPAIEEIQLEDVPLMHPIVDAPDKMVAEYTKMTTGIVLAAPSPSHLRVVTE